MKQLSYSLHTKKPEKPSIYRPEELAGMTLLQLRDICEREKIIHAAINRMDREELCHLILRFRGGRTARLIRELREEGLSRLEEALKKAQKTCRERTLSVPAKLTVYEELDTNRFDGYRIPYDRELDGVNALIVDKEGSVCALMAIEACAGEDGLYLTRSGRIPCRETPSRGYRLLVFPPELSDTVYDLYMGETASLPNPVSLYSIPLIGFFVRKPEAVSMPLSIDFGTSNTVAGMYIESVFYHRIADGIREGQLTPGAVNYVTFTDEEGKPTPVLPSVAGIRKIEKGEASYCFGAEAERLLQRGYLEDGVCVFYDMKRWVGDYEAEEEITDPWGASLMVPRREILRSYLLHVIASAEQRFKCRVKSVNLPFPVKQKERFLALYQELLPEYAISEKELMDEGVSVIYSTIAHLVDEKQFESGAMYRALIIDCGGGTTDLSSCSFTITDDPVAYRIEIETSYENGDTDFGGNNLTYRLLQYLKILLADAITGQGETMSAIAAEMGNDLFRRVDREGKNALYSRLEEEYAAAERLIPTRFRDYEYRSREEYYIVKNNYYLLFTLAERVKKAFFGNPQLMRIVLGSITEAVYDPYLLSLPASRWKLAVRQEGRLSVQKEFPAVVLNRAVVNAVLEPDIYDIIRRFLGPLYQEGRLEEYDIIKLTGQSCRIELFRDCLKEFVPGRLIRQGARQGDYRLKLSCLDGAIRCISDKRLGFAKVSIRSGAPALPYLLSARTHTGEKAVLIHSLDHDRLSGSVSRYLESVELRLTLEDAQGGERYVYSIFCDPGQFRDVTYEELSQAYGEHIPQKRTDDIVNDEIRYFVWMDEKLWGFRVLPVMRQEEQLRTGEPQAFPFESGDWIVNYFDGTR